MRIVRLLLVLAGASAIVFGVMSALPRGPEELRSAAVWFIAPAVLSDLVLLPVIAVIGYALTRWTPAWLRLPVQVALVIIGTLIAVALPFLGKPGLRADNPTLLDRNYVAGLTVYVGVVVLGAAGWAVVRRYRRSDPSVPRRSSGRRRVMATSDRTALPRESPAGTSRP